MACAASAASIAAPPYSYYPQQAAAPIPAAGTAGAAVIYTDGTNALLSVNAGAYSAILTVAASTLQVAYNGGPTITTTATNPVVIQNAAAVNSNLLALTEKATATNANVGLAYTRAVVPAAASTFTGSAITVSNTPTATNSFTEQGPLVSITDAAVAGAGTITYTSRVGLAITMTPTAADGGTGGQTITMGALANGTGLAITHSGVGAGTYYAQTITTSAASSTALGGLAVTCGTKGNAAGILLDWQRDTSNVGDTTGSAFRINRSGTLSGGGTEGGNFFGFNWIPTISTASTTLGAGSSFLEVRDVPVAITGVITYTQSGALLRVTHTPPAVAGGATHTNTAAGIIVTMTPSASAAVRGLLVTMAANTSAAGFAEKLTWNAAAGTGTTVNAIANINGTAVLTAGLTGQAIDLTGFTGNRLLCGSLVVTSASTIADSATTVAAGTIAALGTGVQQIYSQMTVSRVVDWMVSNTQGTIATIRYPAAVTLTATALKGLVIDLATNVTGATNDPAINGLEIQIPATDAANAAGQAAIFVNSLATAARSLDIAAANTSGTIAAILSNANLSGSLTTLSLSATGTPGANACIGVNITIPATTRADTALEAALVISSAATVARVIDIVASNTTAANGLISVRGGTGAQITPTASASYIGLKFDFSNFNPNTAVIKGVQVVFSGGTSGTSNIGYEVDYRGTSGTTAGGFGRFSSGISYTLVGPLTALVLDLVTNITHGSQILVGISSTVPTGAAAGSASYTVGTGQGSAIPHLLGPTDQALLLQAGTAAAAAAGNAITFTASAGSANGAAGSAGGGFTFTPAAGGTATTGTAGNAGTLTVAAAAGGAASGAAGIGGNGSGFTWTGGVGGASSNAASGVAGNGGTFSVTTGNGATSQASNGGAAGSFSVVTGSGGVNTSAGTGGAGGAISFTTSGGGNGGTTGGAAGSYTVVLGNAGTGGAVAGAIFTVTLGTKTGAGAQGYFQVMINDTTNLLKLTNDGIITLGATGAVVNFGQAGTANGSTNVPLLPAFTPGVVAAVGTGWLSIQIAGATRYIPVWT